MFELLFTQHVSVLQESMIKANGETLLKRHLLNSNVSKIFPSYYQILVRQAIPQKNDIFSARFFRSRVTKPQIYLYTKIEL